MSSSPGGSPEGGGGPPRSVLCCPGFVVPGPPAPMAGPGCGLAVLGPGRKRCRGGATLVASAAGRTCRILRLPPAGAGSPPAAGRLVARLEREVGAVALVPSEGGGKSGKGGEESADLFVADRSGRLWRSRGGEGGGWEGGETRPGREPTEARGLPPGAWQGERPQPGPEREPGPVPPTWDGPAGGGASPIRGGGGHHPGRGGIGRAVPPVGHPRSGRCRSRHRGRHRRSRRRGSAWPGGRGGADRRLAGRACALPGEGGVVQPRRRRGLCRREPAP